jgi:hypothetical protein
MNADQILAQTFAEHESLAPDPELTLDGVHQRVRTRRRQTVTRSLTVAAAAATAAAVALGSSLIGADRPAPQQHVAPATATTPAAPAAAPDFVNVAAGWLPPGRSKQVVVWNTFNEQGRGYTVAAAAGSQTYILLGLAPGTALPTAYKRGTPRDLVLAGRPAREWSVDDWYYLATVLPQGRIGTVSVQGGQAEGKGGDSSAAALAAVGRQVAAHLRLDRHDPIRTDFSLTHLPPGFVVRGLNWDTQSGTSYTLAPRAARVTDETVNYPVVAEYQGTRASLTGKGADAKGGKREPTVTPGRPVQGHRTYLIGSRTYPVLFIDSVRPGVSITLAGGTALTDRAELYRIADGLRLR